MATTQVTTTPLKLGGGQFPMYIIVQQRNHSPQLGIYKDSSLHSAKVYTQEAQLYKVEVNERQIIKINALRAVEEGRR
jgi:hypothetical protein